MPAQGELPLGSYWDYPDRHQARLQVIKLYSQGWNRGSISAFLRISRPTVNRWIHRFEADDLAGLADQSRAPKTTPRKVWLPLMIEVYHLQKQHPDVGQFRLWSLLAKPDISERTIGRIMALNRRVYDDIPHNQKRQNPKPSEPHPYKAGYPHQYWFMDGRMMDFALDGIRWWSLIILDGYSRTMVAGAIAPSEASWAALRVLYTACVRYGVPECLISDSGGAFTSNEFEAVCTRLGIDHQTIVSTEGQSYMNLMETHFNIQRRLYDYQFSRSHMRLSWSNAIRLLSRLITPPPIKACSKRALTRRFQASYWPIVKVVSTARKAWLNGFPGRSFPERRIAMAV